MFALYRRLFQQQKQKIHYHRVIKTIYRPLLIRYFKKKKKFHLLKTCSTFHPSIRHPELSIYQRAEARFRLGIRARSKIDVQYKCKKERVVKLVVSSVEITR